MARSTEVLAEGLYFGECPRWRDGRLWFGDFHAHGVQSVSLAGDLRVELIIDDRPSGLGWMPDGSMLIVSMTKRLVLRRTVDGAVTVHADLGAVATFHCNDMAVDAQGRAFVGNFGFNLDAAINERGIESVVKDHPTAVLACVLSSGEVSVARGMHFPNGSVLTPDGAKLIVGETLGGALTAFDVGADGVLTGRRVWASTWPRVPDGIALNADGAVWIANPLAPECVLIAEGGEVLEVIDTGMPCFACMLGAEERRTLFTMTAPTSKNETAAASPQGKLLIANVDAPHAGRP